MQLPGPCCSLEQVVGGEADGSFDRKVLACAGAGLGIISTVEHLNAEYGVFVKPTDPDTLLSLATRQRREGLCASICRLQTVESIKRVRREWWEWLAGWVG